VRAGEKCRKNVTHHSDPVQVRLIRLGSDDAVDGRLEVGSRKELEGVGDVDRDRSSKRLDEVPGAVVGEDLKTENGLSEEKGDRSQISVTLGVEARGFGVLFGGAGFVPAKKQERRVGLHQTSQTNKARQTATSRLTSCI
jgi:hypothetical protein